MPLRSQSSPLADEPPDWKAAQESIRGKLGEKKLDSSYRKAVEEAFGLLKTSPYSRSNHVW